AERHHCKQEHEPILVFRSISAAKIVQRSPLERILDSKEIAEKEPVKWSIITFDIWPVLENPSQVWCCGQFRRPGADEAGTFKDVKPPLTDSETISRIIGQVWGCLPSIVRISIWPLVETA